MTGGTEDAGVGYFIATMPAGADVLSFHGHDEGEDEKHNTDGPENEKEKDQAGEKRE